MTEEKNNKEINQDVLRWIIIGLVGFALIALIFSAGMKVGASKAKYSYLWAESYHKNFAGPRDGFLGDWRSAPPLSSGDFIEGHGAFGEIIQIDDTGLVVRGRGNIEKLIIINQNTTIQKGRDMVKKDELKVNDQIVIVGSPNEDGQIEAKLIRIFNGEDTRKTEKLPRFPFPFFK